MARSTGEIQTDIALTRRMIESHLDTIERHLPHRWWMPYAVLAGGAVAGLVLSRLSVLTLIRTGARLVTTALSLAGAVAAADRFVAGASRATPQSRAPSRREL